MRKILPIALLSAFAGVAALLALRQASPTRESLLPSMRVLQQHEKQLDRAASQVLILSPEEERRIGSEFDARLRNREPAVTPAEEAAFRADEGLVVEVGRPLARAPMVRRFPGNYSFRVLRGRGGNNAFAVPGGFVYVLPGLAAKFRAAPAALAFVLGHEIGHVELGHCGDGVRTREWFGKVGLAPVGDLAGILRVLAQLHFSEVQEIEADEFAVRLLRATRQDPAAALQALDLLELPQDGQTRRGAEDVAWEGLSDYWRTHPMGWERRNRIQRLIGRRAGSAGP
ncbi:MAG: M48 family metalloprotease [Elusimicrobia bacterium]|nr:M48 family metalloprotease [Elusimicrobiota bacterium]